METHVKILGALYIASGILGALGALICFVIFGGAAGIVGVAAGGEKGAEIAVPVLAVFAVALSGLILLLAIPDLVAGFGLLSLRPWAKVLTIVLSVLHLLSIPFGTALGIYGLWVLFNPRTEPLFAPPGSAPAPGAPPAV